MTPTLVGLSSHLSVVALARGDAHLDPVSGVVQVAAGVAADGVSGQEEEGAGREGEEEEEGQGQGEGEGQGEEAGHGDLSSWSNVRTTEPDQLAKTTHPSFFSPRPNQRLWREFGDGLL